jgi:NAD(P)-dependent dehydrogenase (short-subunit alcohol dehydrogenase family)
MCIAKKPINWGNGFKISYRFARQPCEGAAMPLHNSAHTAKPRTIAILTGGNRGLGAALAQALAGRVEALLIVGRAPAQPGAADARVMFEQWDMADPAAAPLAAIEARVRESQVQRIVFINNAAVLRLGGIDEASFPDDLALAMRVNVTSPVRLVSMLLRLAQETERELVLAHIGTGAARRPIRDWGTYCVTKAAMAMVVRQMAEEFPQVTAIDFDPGALATDMQRAILGLNAPGGAADAQARFEALEPPERAAQRLIDLLDLPC